MIAIDKYLTVEWQMTMAEAMQWHFSHVGRLGTLAPQDSDLAERFVAYGNSVTAFDRGFKFPASSPETRQLAELNMARKRQASMVIRIVKDMMEHSHNTEVHVAATAIYEGFLKAYDDVATLSYEADTAAITSLIEESETAEYQPYILRLNLKEHIDELKQLNTLFQTLYEKRYDTLYARKQSGKLKELKIAADKAFAVVIQILSGRLLSETDPAKRAILEEMATRINATIAQFTRIVHQRLGLASSSNDNQKPDISNPDIPDWLNPEEPDEPGDGTENPDASNPPIPPFIPDFE